MLRELKEDFELILFTSGQRDYAMRIIDAIEKNEKFFDFRLVKDNCLHSRTLDLHIKDLKVLLSGRDIRDIVIVDNCTINYML
jgi:TFIIF-interacting CTD phosphatase-like protein